MITLPIAGPALYYLFGVNRRKFKFFALKHFKKRKAYKAFSSSNQKPGKAFATNSERAQLNNLFVRNSGFEVSLFNDVTVLHDGENTFNALFAAMEKATAYIHVQYYTLERGKLLGKMLSLFKKKIEEGVEIRILYDSFGSYQLRGKTKKKFQEIGVSIYPMLPIRFGNLLFSLNYRNHRKIVIIDGEVAFTGGVNVSDKYINAEDELGKWKDVHLKLSGAIVNDIHLIFLKDYFFASNDNNITPQKFISKQKEEGKVAAQVIAGGPDSEQPVILQQYIAMINKAKERIYIANPYFLPGEAFLQTLKIAALKGIDVSLFIPKKSDSKAALYAMFSQFEELMKVGIKIYLRKDFAHSKIMLIDDDMVSIGSGNFDNRSFEHNYETNILIYHTQICTHIYDKFDTVRDSSIEMTLSEFEKRPRWKKFLEGLSKFFKPLL